MEWSHFLELVILKDNYTNDLNEWFNTKCDLMLEMVKIARKGFEVLSKGEGQTTTWQLKNLARVKKEVLAFSWGTNQSYEGHIDVEDQIYIRQVDGSDLMHLELFIFDE